MPGHPSMNSSESEILNSLSPLAELSGMMKLPEIVVSDCDWSVSKLLVYDWSVS